jgi:16S rRNA (guanine(527)-N(7))-methyltransferase RsmG
VNEDPHFSDSFAQAGISLSDRQQTRIDTYIEMLAEWGSRINLTAVRDPSELRRLHFLEAFWAAEHFLDPAWELADIGSGPGFPGMVFKLYRPTLQITLIEKNVKKAVFLRTLARELDLKVTVFGGAAESFDGWETIDCASCRALQPSEALIKTLQMHHVRFLHFRGEASVKTFREWRLLSESCFPLSRNRWVSLYAPFVSRETSARE